MSMISVTKSIRGSSTFFCEQECSREKKFNCRSFTYVDQTTIPGANLCFLSADSRMSSQKGSTFFRPRTLYGERVCLQDTPSDPETVDRPVMKPILPASSPTPIPTSIPTPSSVTNSRSSNEGYISPQNISPSLISIPIKVSNGRDGRITTSHHSMSIQTASSSASGSSSSVDPIQFDVEVRICPNKCPEIILKSDCDLTSAPLTHAGLFSGGSDHSVSVFQENQENLKSTQMSSSSNPLEADLPNGFPSLPAYSVRKRREVKENPSSTTSSPPLEQLEQSGDKKPEKKYSEKKNGDEVLKIIQIQPLIITSPSDQLITRSGDGFSDRQGHDTTSTTAERIKRKQVTFDDDQQPAMRSGDHKPQTDTSSIPLPLTSSLPSSSPQSSQSSTGLYTYPQPNYISSHSPQAPFGPATQSATYSSSQQSFNHPYNQQQHNYQPLPPPPPPPPHPPYNPYHHQPQQQPYPNSGYNPYQQQQQPSSQYNNPWVMGSSASGSLSSAPYNNPPFNYSNWGGGSSSPPVFIVNPSQSSSPSSPPMVVHSSRPLPSPDKDKFRPPRPLPRPKGMLNVCQWQAHIN